jgi:ribosome-associated toxin RatA of RatAB toxin-antitoxin module
MSQKEIENKECTECESAFRLVYTLDDTSGYPKFCPFCSAEMYDDKDEELDEEDS